MITRVFVQEKGNGKLEPENRDLVDEFSARGYPVDLFTEKSSDPNDLQSWCERCEEMFLAEGDKTEAFEAFNDRAIVCCVCYGAFKAQHSKGRKAETKNRRTNG